MGNFSVEVRSSSVVVSGAYTYGKTRDEVDDLSDVVVLHPADTSSHFGGFEVDDVSLDALIVALEQARRIRDHGSSHQWVDAAGTPIAARVFSVAPNVPDDMLLAAVSAGSAAAVQIAKLNGSQETLSADEADEMAADAVREAAGDVRLAEFADAVVRSIADAKELWLAEQARRLSPAGLDD